MSIWMNKFTFPGFVFCPHNPHRKGNRNHTICCSERVIVYSWDIVKGTYHKIPVGRPESETSYNMKTIGFMIRLTRDLWITGKEVIMDSSLCILEGLLEMRNRGVYGSPLIKKR